MLRRMELKLQSITGPLTMTMKNHYATLLCAAIVLQILALFQIHGTAAVRLNVANPFESIVFDPVNSSYVLLLISIVLLVLTGVSGHFDRASAEVNIARDQGQELDTISGLGDRFDKTLASALTIMEASLSSNERHQTLLSDVDDALSNSDEPFMDSKVLQSLIVENAAIKTEVQALETRLYGAQSEATQLRDEVELLKTENFTDGLTRLKNRKWFDTKLSEEVSQALESGSPLSLALLDLDKFKQVNDNYGHSTGDRVLQWTGVKLLENVKGRDSAARYGGEEFAVLLPDTQLSDAETLMDKIRKQFEVVQWTHTQSGRSMGRITASFGIAQLEEGEEPKDLLDRADTNLYSAKAAGRNRVIAK